jgi:putative flippase GtrA
MKTWLRFNAVALAGFAVQAAALQLLLRVLGTHYIAAAAIAVEIAVLHNFLWHRRWTWGARNARASWRLLVRYHLSNGLVSLAGTVALMPLFVAGAGLPPGLANLAATLLCGLVNFALLDRYVFL